ncbi:MAG TPA: cytochrome c [Thermoanaerobaculia bacterium]|nr:cytochrome c [Thermoanaerobaculia bacterium]
MRVPPSLNILGIAVGATLLYTWVGQLVPQKEVHPPEVVEMAEDISTAEMVEIGQEIFVGKGLCNTCHTIGSSGALRFPDLAGIATRAGERVPGQDALTYMAASLYEPNGYIVPGFNPGMPEIDAPPIALSDDEIRAVLAYLQTLGGEATMTMATVIPFAEGAETTSDVDPPGGATAAQDAAAAQVVATTPAGAVGDGGEALLARFGCTECHAAEAGGEGSLAGVGGRLDRPAIQRRLIAHEPPLPETTRQRVTLADVEAMTDYLAGLGGQG